MSKHFENIIPFGAILLSIVFGFLAYHFTDDEVFQNIESENFTYKKTKILIVPGHDEKNFGSSYKEIVEEKLNLQVADYLLKDLREVNNIEVISLRNNEGYNETFEKYFLENQKEIENFIKEHKDQTKKLINNNEFVKNQSVKHNFASEEISLRLYAINKWAAEQNFDLIVHIHFNDYPGRKKGVPGKYRGFSIYIPESQLSNSSSSRELAENIKSELSAVLEPTDYPSESEILIEDQDLIAVGANHTLEITSILIEYGYIYESIDLEKAAKKTGEGIRNFLKIK